MIISFDGNVRKEGIKVKIDNGKSIEYPKDTAGYKLRFKTPAKALMYFESLGWELKNIGATVEGETKAGTGESDTVTYWIFRKPCTKEELEKTPILATTRNYNMQFRPSWATKASSSLGSLVLPIVSK